MSSNMVVLKSAYNCHEEYRAAAAITPGHLLERTSAGKVQKHSVYGAWAERLFAKEDAYQGLTIDDAYAADDLVFVHDAQPGDVINGLVPAGAVAISNGDRLISNGDGTLVKSPITNLDAVYSNVAASAAVTNDTAETAFDKSYTFPANSLKVGDVIRVRVQTIATSTNSTDTLNIKLKIGSTVIAATGAVDVANNDIGYIEAVLIVRTIGASGTFVATGQHSLGASGTVTAKAFFLASTTVDTTATQAITVSATWSVASASNSVRLDVLEISVDRSGGENIPLAVAAEAVDNSAGVAVARLAYRVL